MSTITMHVTDLDRAMRRLNANMGSTLRAITWAIGEAIRNKLAVYPKRSSGPVLWTSERQRRYYYAMRRRAGLPLRYTRQFDPMSQRLGPSWTVSHKDTTGAKVATRTSYAPFVQHVGWQQPMHAATGWVTDRAAIDAVVRSGDAQEIVRQAIRKAIGT